MQRNRNRDWKHSKRWEPDDECLARRTIVFTILFDPSSSHIVSHILNSPSLPLYLLDHTGPKNRVLGFLGRRTPGLDDPAYSSASPSGRSTPGLDLLLPSPAFLDSSGANIPPS